jgi:hypothetical protein
MHSGASPNICEMKRKTERPRERGRASHDEISSSIGTEATRLAGTTEIGAVTGHMKGGMTDQDLKQLGEVLNKGEAGLIAVYATNMADQIAGSIEAGNRYVSNEIDSRADELAKQIKEVEASAD